jgi:hypothetical protein
MYGIEIDREVAKGEQQDEENDLDVRADYKRVELGEYPFEV